VSQCETEEPDSNGLGVYIVAAGVSSSKVAFTPEPSCALIVFPTACVIESTGIVIVGSEPDIPGGPPDTLFAMITPTAPAS